MDVVLIGGATMPVNRWALRQEYFKWYEAGVIDDIAFLAETDVKGKEEILERQSRLSQAMGHVDQLEEVIKKKDGTIETLERQIIQSGIKIEILKANTEVQKAKIESESEIEAVTKIETSKQKLKTKEKSSTKNKKNENK